jgi:DnaJ like chaperone protein
MKRNRGKLFGAALGFSFGGPIGALLGTAIGHLVDIVEDEGAPGSRGGPLGRSNENLTFITSLVYLLVGTARSDGTVTGGEIDTIRNFFQHQLGYGAPHMIVIDRIVDAAVEEDIDLNEACDDITGRTVYEERLFLIRLCFEIALADRQLNTAEDDFIRRAAGALGIGSYDFMMVRRTFVEQEPQHKHEHELPNRPPHQRSPHAVLGVPKDCSIEEARQAYRTLAAKYHPDKVSHLGAEFTELATAKFAEIQNAFDSIARGEQA